MSSLFKNNVNILIKTKGLLNSSNSYYVQTICPSLLYIFVIFMPFFIALETSPWPYFAQLLLQIQRFEVDNQCLASPFIVTNFLQFFL